MATRRSNLWLFLALVPVVLAFTLGFWGLTAVKIGTDGDDTQSLLGNQGTGADLTGTPQNDLIKGCGGHDAILGGESRDRLYGDGRPGAAGCDPNVADGSDTILGEDGNDYIRGGDDDDLIEGNDGNDQLFGEKGDDDLYGGDGNDILDGGEGTDYLSGGGGKDVFYLRPGQSGDGNEIVECTANETDESRVVLLRTGRMGFPRGTPSGTFTDTTITILDPDGEDGAFHIEAGPGKCRILRR